MIDNARKHERTFDKMDCALEIEKGRPPQQINLLKIAREACPGVERIVNKIYEFIWVHKFSLSSIITMITFYEREFLVAPEEIVDTYKQSLVKDLNQEKPHLSSSEKLDPFRFSFLFFCSFVRLFVCYFVLSDQLSGPPFLTIL